LYNIIHTLNSKCFYNNKYFSSWILIRHTQRLYVSYYLPIVYLQATIIILRVTVCKKNPFIPHLSNLHEQRQYDFINDILEF